MQITLDEGYQFGLGLFETVSVENKRPLFLGWHLERLHQSLDELGISRLVTEAEIMHFLSSQNADHFALKIMVSEKTVFLPLVRIPIHLKCWREASGWYTVVSIEMKRLHWCITKQ